MDKGFKTVDELLDIAFKNGMLIIAEDNLEEEDRIVDYAVAKKLIVQVNSSFYKLDNLGYSVVESGLSYKEYIESQKPKPTVHIGHNITGSSIKNSNFGISETKDKTVKEKFSIKNVVITIVVGLIVAYLVYKFGWNK